MERVFHFTLFFLGIGGEKMEQKTIELILKELAVVQSKLDDTRTDLKDIRDENKENFQRILQLKDKQAELEKEVSVLKTKVENLTNRHERDNTAQNQKWDIPTKILIAVLTAVITAVLALILK